MFYKNANSLLYQIKMFLSPNTVASVVKVFTECESLLVLDMSGEEYNHFSVATTTLIVNDMLDNI